MKRVLILLATGFEEIEAVTVIDTLRRAGVEVAIGGVDGAEITGAHGIAVKSDCLLVEADMVMLDMLVIPGGDGAVDILANDPRVQQLVKKLHALGKPIAAICAAPYLLDTLDLLPSKYTCYPSSADKIKKAGYTADQNVVHDGQIITSRGPSTAMEFALYLVEQLENSAVKERVKNDLLV